MSVPSGCYWGVDSLLPIHKPIGGKASLLELVREKANATPRFWGRYIGTHNGENALSKDEIEFLRTHSPITRLLINYNSVHGSGNEDAGRRDAHNALSAASLLGVDAQTVIYANAEPDSGGATAAWILGWWEALKTSEHETRGGIYGNTSGGRGHLEHAYAEALRKKSAGFRLPPLWAMYPLKGPKPPEEIAFPYQPDQLKCAPAAVVWQFAVNCYKYGKNGVIDMDLCTQVGYEGMWKVGQTLFPPTDAELKAMTAGRAD